MPVEPARQLSLFGVEAGEPAPADLAGLLAGPGEVVRMGGTARVSMTVDAAWRVHVLAAEFAARGLAASWLPAQGAGYRVRTAYTGLLAPLAAAWLREGGKRPPPRFHLNGHRLRLWVAAAGNVEPLGFLLRLGAGDELCWEPVGAALAAIGLPAVLVTPRVVARAVPAVAASPAGGEPARENEPRPDDDPRSENRSRSAGKPRAGGRPMAESNGRPESSVRSGSGSRSGSKAGPEESESRAESEPPVDGEDQPEEVSGPPLGPAYRITGRRRLTRLAELVGERPAAAPAHAWPATPA
ncbi:hypothetical protein [Rhizomonospora bruguierae]|uniref:hypothetical protein n=1 Tax=Rhizomonospora bruguierae TaxID=1581705 RepID=UPI0020BDCD0A|nr:hypothetical protein [Micromonospora sp. NBRC 107566]